MTIRLLVVGRLRERYLAEAAADFRARLRHYVRVEEVELTAAHGGDAERAKREEGERVLRGVGPEDTLWLLERGGMQLSSLELCERLAALRDGGTGRLTLAIAGTYGASEALLLRANFRWSLSRLTFLHEWTRAIVLEQLYRAAKIDRNEPYHH